MNEWYKPNSTFIFFLILKLQIVFRQELLPHMLGILIKLLIYRTAVGTLLQEEVCTTCQNLAAVDFPVYFDSFLPTFLTTIPQLSPMEIQQLLNAPKDTV